MEKLTTAGLAWLVRTAGCSPAGLRDDRDGRQAEQAILAWQKANNGVEAPHGLGIECACSSGCSDVATRYDEGVVVCAACADYVCDPDGEVLCPACDGDCACPACGESRIEQSARPDREYDYRPCRCARIAEE